MPIVSEFVVYGARRIDLRSGGRLGEVWIEKGLNLNRRRKRPVTTY